MAEGKEVQRKCVHCGKRFAVMRYGRESLPRICPRCTDALKRERVAQQAALKRMTPAQERRQRQPGEPSLARIHRVRAKPASQ